MRRQKGVFGSLLGPFAEQEVEWAHQEVDRLRVAKGLEPLYSKGTDKKDEDTTDRRLANSN